MTLDFREKGFYSFYTLSDIAGLRRHELFECPPQRTRLHEQNDTAACGWGIEMAPTICRKTRVAFYPVPKNASSMLRDVFFQLENGFPFRSFTINGRQLTLFWLYGHNHLFKPSETPEGYAKIAIVRDPVKRFISNYKFLVLNKHDTAIKEIPDVNTFVSRFEEFVGLPMTGFHLLPQIRFLGPDLNYFDKVFRMEALSDVADYLSERLGTEIRLPVKNQGSDHEVSLSEASIEKLKRLYQADYQLLRAFYSA